MRKKNMREEGKLSIGGVERIYLDQIEIRFSILHKV